MAQFVTPTQQQELLTLLQQNKLGVVSTVSVQNTSESALVAFAEDNNGSLYFQTRVNSRKYKNIQNNPHVSFVIGWDQNVNVTLQYEGVASEISPTEEVKRLFILKDSPSTKEYLDHPDARFFKVMPHWIRYSDYTTDSPATWETEFQ